MQLRIVLQGVTFILGYDEGRPEACGRSWKVNILVHVKTDIQNFSTEDTASKFSRARAQIAENFRSPFRIREFEFTNTLLPIIPETF